MRQHQGFTLLELVATIAILSVLALGIVGFIQSSTQGYIDFRKRDELQSEARFAVERIGREVRHAVPNSLLVNPLANCMTYTPIVFAGMYNEMKPETNTLDIALSTLDPDWGAKINDGKHRVVFDPLIPESLKAASVDKASSSYAITAVSGNRLTLDKDPAKPWPLVKRTKRLYVYKDPVTFCFEKNAAGDKNLLTRRVGASGPVTTLAENVSPVSRFTIEDKSLSQSNLVHVYYKFDRSGEISVYNQQIQVLNVP